MANKFLDDVGLAHLWDKATSIFAKKTEVEASIAECQKPFIVTATADFANGVMTNVSHTYTQIIEAYNRGDHIFVETDIGQMVNGQKTLLNLSNYNSSVGKFIFEQVIRQAPNVIFVTGVIKADNTNSFTIKYLVEQTQLDGLTFTVSNTVPTVDDRSIITFVVEE